MPSARQQAAKKVEAWRKTPCLRVPENPFIDHLPRMRAESESSQLPTGASAGSLGAAAADPQTTSPAPEMEEMRSTPDGGGDLPPEEEVLEEGDATEADDIKGPVGGPIDTILGEGEVFTSADGRGKLRLALDGMGELDLGDVGTPGVGESGPGAVTVPGWLRSLQP